jgi:NO-binding membrane sensor protein with MHYT domain
LVGRGGIEAHRFYGNALLLPFLLAALMGSAGNFQFRRRVGPAALDASKVSVLLATFAWCVMCLTAMVAVDWVASRVGVLGREPNDWVDSAGMVLALSLLFSIMAMCARSEST